MKGLLVFLIPFLLGSCASTVDQEPLPAPPPQSPTAPATKVIPPVSSHIPSTTPKRFCVRAPGCAPVVPLELTGSELVPPADPMVLGWWGAKVNANRGTILLVGHTVHDGGGFLDNLEKVPVGSSVGVSGASYEVVSNRVISKAKLAQIAPKLFSQTGPNRLVVVTCEDYNPATGHYGSNVVMVAK